MGAPRVDPSTGAPVASASAGALTGVAETRLVASLTARDYVRRPGAWVTTLVTGTIFALLVAGSGGVGQRVQERAEAISFRVAVQGDREGAARFLADLADPRLVLTPSDDASGEVTQSRSSSGMILPDGLDARIDAGEPTELRIFYRAGNDNSQTSLNTVALRLQDLEAGRLEDLLVQAGTPAPGSVRLEEVEVRRDDRVNRAQTARTLAALVCLLCLGVVSAVASLGGSGRERRGVEPVLVLPLRRSSLTAGQSLGAFPLVSLQLFAAVGIVVGATSLPLLGLGQPLPAVLAMLAIALPAAALLGLLASGAGCLAGVIGTGSDDAVSLGDFFAVPFVLVGILLFLQPDLALTPLTAVAPILGPALALRDGISGELSVGTTILVVASTIGWFAGLQVLAARRVGDERRVLRATR